MLYYVSGATASGKSTVTKAVAERFPGLIQFEEDSRLSRTTDERRANLELWIQDALELERDGKDVILGSHSPLGELLAVASAPKLEGIAACLLDAHDFVRLERWEKRGVSEGWPMTIDHFCWAAFHRLHARDPQYDQRVLLDQPGSAQAWERWTHWTASDTRWTVPILDSSSLDFAATVDLVSAWVASVENSRPALRRDARWWT